MAASLLLAASGVQAQASQITPFGSTISGVTDKDDGFAEVNLTGVFPSGVNFGGTVYTSMFVGSNGYITFGRGDDSFDPEGIAGYTKSPIIAGGYDDLNLGAGGDVYYTQNGPGGYAMVSFLSAKPYQTPKVGSGTNTFQILLRRFGSDPQDFQIEIRYADMNWAKSGNIGAANAWPTGGWSAGDRTSYAEVPNSGTPDFLDVQTQSNVGETGVYRWNVVGGVAQAPPTVTATTAPTSITATSAESGGTISSENGSAITARGVVWGTASGPTLSDNVVTSGTGIGSFTTSLTGLPVNSTVYVRAYATNGEGTTYGPERSFSTPKRSQTVTFSGFGPTTYGDAPVTLGATASSGLPVSYTSSDPNVATISGNTLTIVGQGSATVTASQSGDATFDAATPVQRTLNVGRKSVQGSFTVTDPKPWDGTDAANVLTRSLTGVIPADAGSVELVGGTATFDSPDVGTNKTVTLTGAALSGAGADNYTLAGVDDTQADIIVVLPTVTTVNTSGITATSAVIEGTVDSDGGAPVTARGVVWSTSSGPTLADNVVPNGSGTGAFTTSVTGLPVNTTVDVRTYATNSAGTTYGAQLIITTPKQSQTITFPALAGATYGDAPITLGATASSGLPVSYTSSDPSVATISGNTLTIIGVGSVNVTASQGGDGTFDPATPVVQTLTVARKSVQGSFTVTDPKSWDGTDAANVLTRSLTGVIPADVGSVDLVGGTATFDSPDVGTNKTVTLTGASLSGAGAGNYALAGVDATQADIIAILPTVATVDATGITDTSAEIDGTIDSDGGAPVTARGVVWSTSPGPTLADNVVTNGSGTGAFTTAVAGLPANVDVYLRTYATNSAGTTYGAELTISTLPSTQTITFPALSPATYGDGPITLSATASSGLPVSYSSSDPNVATISGNTLTITGAGPVVITADQPGDGTFNPAFPVLRRLDVARRPVQGSFTVTDPKPWNGSDAANVLTRSLTGVLPADAGAVELAGGSATFDSPDVGTNKTVTLTGAGLAGARAINYTLTGVDDTQAAIVPVLPNTITAGVSAVTDVSAEIGGIVDSNGGAPVTARGVVWSTSPAPTLADNVVPNGSGVGIFGTPVSGLPANADVYLRTYATNAAGTSYGADLVVSTLAATQTITFPGPAPATYGDAPITLGATASSGLPVSYTSSNPAVATISGNTLTITGAGTAVITASQPGDATFTAASPVLRPMIVAERPVRGSFTVADPKPWDGTDAADVLTRSLTGVLPADAGSVELFGGSATFDSPDVGTNKTVTLTGAGLSGARAINYTLSGVDDAQAAIVPVLPTAITAGVSAVTATSAEIGGIIDTNGGVPVTARGVVWSTSPQPTLADNVVPNGSGSGPFETVVNGLSPDLTTYLRTYATNSVGTSYGADLVVRTLPGTQTITFPSPAPATYGDAPITLGATASSGLPIVYTSSNPNVATISGSTLTITGAGTVVITAEQPGGGGFTAASPVLGSLTVDRRPVQGSFTVTNPKVFDGTATADVLTRSLAGVVPGEEDKVELVEGTATFDSPDIGADKTVTLSGARLSGGRSINYTLTGVDDAQASIVAGPPDNLTIEPVANIPAGPQSTEIRLMVRDAFGNPTGVLEPTTIQVESDLAPDSVIFAPSSEALLETGDSTAVLQYEGTFETAGLHTLQATVTSGQAFASSSSATREVTVVPGTTATFRIEAAAGGDIGPQSVDSLFDVRISALDEFGNVATSFADSVTLSSTPPAAISAGTVTAAFEDGVLATHSVSISQAGVFTLTATGPGDVTGVSGRFPVIGPDGGVDVSLVADDPRPAPGDTLVIRVLLTNTRDVAVTDLSVPDPLADQDRLEVLGVEVDSGSIDETTGVWSIPSLDSSAQAVLTVTVFVRGPAPPSSSSPPEAR